MKKIKSDEPRILIPFFDKTGNIFAYQGRDLLGKSKLKYITVKLNPKAPLIFGLDRLDTKQDIMIVEGPLDSLFLPNCIASVNASLSSTASWLMKGLNKSPNDIIIVHDNEPRNKVIVSEYMKSITAGFKTVIWPGMIDAKDINAMYMAGVDYNTAIKRNTYQGLTAQLNFNKWKKV